MADQTGDKAPLLEDSNVTVSPLPNQQAASTTQETSPPPPEQPLYPDTGFQPPQPSGYAPQPDIFTAPGSQPLDVKIAPPPPYEPQSGASYPQIQTTNSTNVVVVQQQPTVAPVVQTVTRHHGTSDHGLIFAVFTTCCVFWFGGWCGLICTIAGIIFAVQAQHEDRVGNTDAMRQNHQWSYVMSTIGIATGCFVFFMYVIGALIGSF